MDSALAFAESPVNSFEESRLGVLKADPGDPAGILRSNYAQNA